MSAEDDDPRAIHYRAFLSIHSEETPYQVMCAALGAPTRGHEKGHISAPGRMAYLTAHWSWTAPIPKPSPLREHVDAVLEFVEHRLEALNSLHESCRIKVSCGIYEPDDPDGPAMDDLPLETWERLEAFGLPIEFHR
jgi:hypothetical protein